MHIICYINITKLGTIEFHWGMKISKQIMTVRVVFIIPNLTPYILGQRLIIYHLIKFTSFFYHNNVKIYLRFY